MNKNTNIYDDIECIVDVLSFLQESIYALTGPEAISSLSSRTTNGMYQVFNIAISKLQDIEEEK